MLTYIRSCRKCKNDFVAKHRATYYCDTCVDEKCECGNKKSVQRKYCSTKCAGKNNKGNSPQTRFKSNWIGEKECSKCHNNFLATSGNRKFCDACIKELSVCPECGKEKSIFDSFCGNSCAGKWKYRNSESVRKIINAGAVIGRATAKGRPSSLKGIPKPHLRGSNNPAWKGGLYIKERTIDMGRVEYKNWRILVFKRDNYTCIKCKVRGGKLNADHILPYKLFPELRYSTTNGRTLCESCHRKTSMYGEAVKQVTRDEFLIF